MLTLHAPLIWLRKEDAVSPHEFLPIYVVIYIFLVKEPQHSGFEGIGGAACIYNEITSTQKKKPAKALLFCDVSHRLDASSSGFLNWP